MKSLIKPFRDKHTAHQMVMFSAYSIDLTIKVHLEKYATSAQNSLLLTLVFVSL